MSGIYYYWVMAYDLSHIFYKNEHAYDFIVPNVCF